MTQLFLECNSKNWTRWVLCLSSLVCAAGCGESKESLHEMDHVTPAHWPSDLTDAAHKLQERLARLKTSSAEADAAMALKELKDLVGWVPEVAADTDLPEKDWDKLYTSSEIARKKLLSTEAINPEITQDIEQLCALLTEAQTLIPQPLVAAELAGSEELAE